MPGYNVLTRKDGTIRHFWRSEGGKETADPGQDSQDAPDMSGLWVDPGHDARRKGDGLVSEVGRQVVQNVEQLTTPKASSVLVALRSRANLVVRARQESHEYGSISDEFQPICASVSSHPPCYR